MSGDYSRHRFDPRNNYAGVKMQQGRVQLDADWNEWTDAIDRRARAETVDIFGISTTLGIDGVAVVSPQTPDAFLIEVSGGSFTIGQGRMYVDGLLAENFGDEDGPQSFDPVLAELRGLNPIAYDQQPYHLDPADLPEGGPHLAYLEVWQREVTHLQQPELVEKAVGVDTTTRTQTVWQVRLLEEIADSISSISPDAALGAAWDAIISPSAARLSSRAVGVPSDIDPCELPPSGGYRGLENQLYRIEIHDGGNIGTATFKWSRDNGSVASSVVELVSDTELKLASLGRDDVLRFNTGNWVEILDDWREFSGEGGDPTRRVGEIRQIVVDETKRSVSFSPALPTNMIPTDVGDDTLAKRHLRVIRWDQKGVVRDNDDNIIVDLDVPGGQGVIPVPGPGVWVHLENGVQVQFTRDPADGDFRCNDYWTVAARTTDGSVDILTGAPPQGIHRHYARLALVDFPEDEDDCRTHWPPDCGGCCNVIVEPGDEIQAAINSLPLAGGCVCLRTGVHVISEPLTIRGSNIKFYGESPGTIVRDSTGLIYMLEIGDGDLVARDIEILSIRFETTVPSDGAFVLYLNSCAEVRVENCELAVLTQQPSAHIGIRMQEVQDVVICNNRLHNLYGGIWVDDCHDRLVIENNIIEGILLNLADGNIEFSLSVYGIRIVSNYTTPCQILYNRISHFHIGVRLADGTRYSQVVGNAILRVGGQSDVSMPTTIDELRSYLYDALYAIVIDAGYCGVTGNHISLPNYPWGGIRTTGEHTMISDNILRSSSKGSLLTPVPAGIYCLGLVETGLTAYHSKVGNNKLIGPQVGIVISRVDEVIVEDNFIDGMSGGWFGVRVDDCNDTRVCGNRVDQVLFATYHSAGEGNQISDNNLTGCGMGITSLSENNLNMSNNTVTDCLVTGILPVVAASATLLGNRVYNCGYAGTIPFGIVVFAERIFGESDALVRIEGNEVIDTGINPLTGVGVDSPAVGIGGLFPACQVSHNRTGYSDNALNPQLEHRALLLIGPFAVHYDLARGTIELMFGSAVVTDNHFRGPGRTHLVEFLPVPINDNFDFRFEKVTFNNNICDHLQAEPQEDKATVRLWGRNLIAMGNHIKADVEVNSMSLGNRDRVVLMGNITTGGYIRVSTTTPTPLTNFNIRT